MFAAVSQPNALDMATWHTCETTHCRAGWVVTLAGDEGKALEAFHRSTPLAAALIYRDSSKIHIPMMRFYENNEDAMADMKKMAELEISSNKGE